MWGFRWPSRRTIRCPDGTTRLVEDVDSAFPLYIKGYNASASADVKGVDIVETKVSAKYKDDIKGFLYGLNKRNESLMMSFRAVYSAYSAHPCGHSDYLLNGVAKLLDEQRSISELQIKISALITLAANTPDDSERIGSIYANIAGILGGVAVAPAASIEMQAARDAAIRLLAGDAQ